MTSQSVYEGLLKFSLRLYKQTACNNTKVDNIVCSPLVIAAGICTLLAGAQNKTAQELHRVLQVKASVDKLRDYFTELMADLTTYAPYASIHVASRSYSEQQLPLKADYASRVESFFVTTVKSVDFRHGHEAARQEANAWVSQQMASKIRDLIPPGIINAGTSSILLNAVYVQGFWQSPFQWKNTRPQEFHVDSENSVVVNMLYQDHSYKMAHSEVLRARALEIPCRGHKVSMVIVLPDAQDGLALLQERLTPSRLCHLLSSLSLVMDVELSLPKFTVDSSIALKDSLCALGAKELFCPFSADLSGMFESARPALADMIHRTFVQVDEGGMDAACWCALTTSACCASLPLYPKRFVVDHPFMFLIKANEPDQV
ncbi:hypothetical protein MTO96_044143, partial [Rhipicephalus appendiculatus]